MTTTFLEAAEVAELTGYQRRSGQVRALSFMGIDHKIRPDGTVAILRTAMEACFSMRTKGVGKATEPNWDALHSNLKESVKPTFPATPNRAGTRS